MEILVTEDLIITVFCLKKRKILKVGIPKIGVLSYLEFFNGGLAQLARAPALHAGGHRFDSDILHIKVL